MRLERLDFLHRINVPIITPVYVVPAPYAGPGDVVSGARSWWGLRAYTLALVGNTVIRLRRDSDNAEQDFVTVSGGGLDLASITSFQGAANLFVVTLYDQLLVASSDLTNSTAGTQLQFIPSGIGAKPIIRCTATLFVRSGSDIQMTQPYTISWAGKRTGAFTTATGVLGETNGEFSGFEGSTNTIFGQCTTHITGTAADNSFHAIQFVANGASSDININGTTNVGNAGSANYGGAGSRTDVNVSRATVADLLEFGLWDNGFSGAESSAMSANQHTFWGF